MPAKHLPQDQIKPMQQTRASANNLKSNYCDTCGKWDSSLSQGMCPTCQEFYLSGRSLRTANTSNLQT